MEHAVPYPYTPEPRRGDPLLTVVLAASLLAAIYPYRSELVGLWDSLQGTIAHAQSSDTFGTDSASPPIVTSPSGQQFGRVPVGPQRPSVTTRPASWPGGAPAEVDHFQQPAAAAGEPKPADPNVTPVQYVDRRSEAPAWDERTARRSTPGAPYDAATQGGADLQRLTDATIIAKVGAEVILAADVMPDVNAELEKHADDIPPEQMELARAQLIRQRLTALLQTKLVYNEVLSKVPEENLKTIRERTIEHFEKVRLPGVMEDYSATSPADLDAKLRKTGSSLQRERESFIEQAIASSWVRQNTQEKEEEVTRQEMLEYYHAHIEDFQFQAKSRWQQLTIRYDGRLSKEEAWAKLAQLGNQILDGAPFEEMAKAHSSGFAAEKGGQRDWTTKGSLKSKVLDEAIFNLPVGGLSPILDDGEGAFHIVRVLEREEAGQVPFLEAQVEIREEIKNGRTSNQFKDYVTKLQKTTPIWTIFD